MFVRITKFQVKTESIERAVNLYRKSVIPAARAQKGYQKAVVMVNRENGEGRSITFWNSRADILANERNRYYQQQLIKFANLFTAPPIREEYEVIIQEE